ncbi:MAG: hypothetical protein Q8M29_07825 [Bacteroidota bacterium]|nr:hypothetical protein [Bacteroidota bacterium]
MKRIVSILGGLAAAVAVIALVEMIGHMIFATPVPADMKTKEEMAAYVANLPLGAFMSVLIAMALGSFTGGFVATKINKENGKVNSTLVAIILMTLGIVNLVMIPHPTWFMVVNLLLYVPFAWIGFRLAK